MSIRGGGTELSEGEKNIVYNLRYQYKEKVADVSDKFLVRVFDEWSCRENQEEDYLMWLRDIDWSAEKWAKE